MQVRKTAFRPTHTQQWTRERVDELSKQDIQQLRVNAETLGETAVVALCDEALEARPKAAGKRNGALPPPRAKSRRLTSRSKAFQARGVFLSDERTSWSGVRKSDGAVVMMLWAGAVQSKEGGCCYLLWAPNIDGARPWSETAAGKERLEHCRLALKQGKAEGLLVYGERLDDHLPEHKARSIHGVDPEVVVHLQLEQHGEEYWAVWGRKAG